MKSFFAPKIRKQQSHKPYTDQKACRLKKSEIESVHGGKIPYHYKNQIIHHAHGQHYGFRGKMLSVLCHEPHQPRQNNHNDKYLQIIGKTLDQFRNLNGKDIADLRQKTLNQIIGQLFIIIPPEGSADSRSHTVFQLVYKQICHTQYPGAKSRGCKQHRLFQDFFVSALYIFSDHTQKIKPCHNPYKNTEISGQEASKAKQSEKKIPPSLRLFLPQNPGQNQGKA